MWSASTALCKGTTAVMWNAVSCSACFALNVRVWKVHTCESVEESVNCGRLCESVENYVRV